MVEAKRIDDLIATFTNGTQISLTKYARDLVVLVVGAITEDQHPRWKFQPAGISSPQKTAETVGEALPLFLFQIARESQVRPPRQITTFDVLHWISSHLDLVCPIEK